ncbi:MAG: flagellin [Syntrophobacteraceae bacterium]|jgi:flagellar hook-associated protein 3 FlgL
MRITLGMQTNQTLLTLNDQQEQINQLSQQISSGVKLSSPSDDPFGWAQVMNVNQGLQEYNSILSGINFGTGWAQATGSALSQLSNLVSQAQQIAISAGSATGTAQSATLASEVNGILQQAVNLANSQYGDQYIFGGTSTTSAPYSMDDLTGSGDSNPIQVKTGTSDATAGGSTVVNLTGNDVFSFTSGGNTLNVLQVIAGLGQALQTGDSATVSSDITTLNDAYNHINNEAAINGATLSDLSTQKSAINVMQTNAQSTLSNLDDTNIAEATTKLSQAQTAFQAALQVTGMLDNLNLASYLSSTSIG